MAMMATYCNALLLMVSCGFFAAVNGDFIMPTTLNSNDILCLEECNFFAGNQTIAIINSTNPNTSVTGVAYYRSPIRMKDLATQRVASFNTSFTFREQSQIYNAAILGSAALGSNVSKGEGFTFVISNSTRWKGDAGGRLGIFATNPKDNPKVVAVEFDSWSDPDTDPGLLQEGHVGLDVRSPISVPSCFAYVYDTLGITLWKGDVLYSWIEYDGRTSILQVRLANTSSRPLNPLVNCSYPFYDTLDEFMWIGFSGSTGNAWSMYDIYNWTFTSFGISEFLGGPTKSTPIIFYVGLILGIVGGILVALAAVGVCAYWRRAKRARNVSWDNQGMVEMAGMPGFISYKHLSAATKQFSDQSKLGEGGFGSVYRGVLPKTGAQVAVKRVSNDSRQGRREFLAEVQIISQLRHRNVVELIGFCRDRGKFLLVYELLPRGSLDQALFKPRTPEAVLSWDERWKIVAGTAEALHYLHEGWRQQVIHRDVKSSNIMLDDEYNPKLGDFGLARLVDHQMSAATTMVAGTFGYIAPEATGGKFTDKTDVYAFGAVALEVACGRKAYDPSVKNNDDLILVDMVWRHLKEDDLLGVADPLLLKCFDVEQMEEVLKLGLLCSHPDPASRPTMRQVVQVLAGDVDVPEVPHSRPRASLASDMPHLSITDLLNSRSSIENSMSGEKRPASSTSQPPSSSFCSSASVGTQLFPKVALNLG